MRRVQGTQFPAGAWGSAPTSSSSLLRAAQNRSVLPDVFAHRVERHHRRGNRQQRGQKPLARDRQHDHQHHLQHGLDLAAHARRDDVPLLHGAQPQTGDAKLCL